MNTQMKWSVLPVALLMIGTVTLAQSQTPTPQTSGSSASTNTTTQPDSTTGQHKEIPKDASAKGAQNGSLTADEAPNMKTERPAIFGVTNVDRPANGDQLLLIANMGVNSAMDDLSHAFANKDLNAIKQLWPSIPQKPSAALGKSFAYFKSVSRDFKPESIEVNGDTATVVGSYSGSFVNGGTTILSIGKFHATLKKSGTQWTMVSLECN
jgi:hypothetical protein